MRFIKADRIFSGQDYLPADSVLALNEAGLLQDVIPEASVDPGNVLKLEGTLAPGFVNAHCHLELSHLKDKISRGTGLPLFAREIVKVRNIFVKEAIKEAMAAADAEMWGNGIVAVGDISNGSDSFETKEASDIYYHTFIELIGLNPAMSKIILEKGLQLLEELEGMKLQGSLAPHAPYSTSKELIKLIADHDSKQRKSFSIHNQESEEETKFFNGHPNGFDGLYQFLGLDISWFKAPGTSSLAYYSDALPDTNAILVHDTFTNAEDIAAVKGKKVYWCFCPGANDYIEGRLPEPGLFKELKENICIGTDSLASNSRLDLVAEANMILGDQKVFTTKDLLQAMTFNGAKALGVSDRFGRLITGKNAGLNLLREHKTSLQFIKKIN